MGADSWTIKIDLVAADVAGPKLCSSLSPFLRRQSDLRRCSNRQLISWEAHPPLAGLPLRAWKQLVYSGCPGAQIRYILVRIYVEPVFRIRKSADLQDCVSDAQLQGPVILCYPK